MGPIEPAMDFGDEIEAVIAEQKARRERDYELKRRQRLDDRRTHAENREYGLVLRQAWRNPSS